jgi:hypothetical protein
MLQKVSEVEHLVEKKQQGETALRAVWNPRAAPVCRKMQGEGVYKQVVNLLVIGIQDLMEERYVKISEESLMLLAG